MPLFLYKAVDKNGQIVSGRIERSGKDAVSDYIYSSSLIPIEIKKADLLQGGFLNSNISDFGNRVGSRDMAIFCRQLSFVLEAGVLMGDAIALIQRQTKNKQLSKALSNVNQQLHIGKSLSASISQEKAFPTLFSNMLRVSEFSSNIPHIMAEMASYYEREAKISQEVKGAFAYPAMVGFMMICVIIIAMIYVVPSYAEMFLTSGVELPVPTRALIATSNFIITYYRQILAFIGLTILLLIGFFRTSTGKSFIGATLTKLPVFGGFYLKLLNLRISQTLYILICSGVQELEALKICGSVLGNSHLSFGLNKIILAMEQGKGFAEAAEGVGAIEPILVSMVKIGEETGKLQKTLEKCSGYLQNETEVIAGRLTKLLEPVITVILGVVLAVVMLAILLPTFSLINVV